ncbi:MAG: type II toxin-antitoxin system ParD family antitoxin [Micrococcales bacterium]|nr:type II toxin-antitoxin system ParD family antitoxin [Micrococcales bacterium]
MPTSVALGDHFEGFVRQQLVSGRFNNVSEVVRAGLRLLEDADQRRAAELDALRADVRAGLASGPRVSAEEVFDRLDTKYAAQVAARGGLGKEVAMLRQLVAIAALSTPEPGA